MRRKAEHRPRVEGIEARSLLSSTALDVGLAGAGSAVYGTAVGSGQLEATANVPGTFVYTPGAGTILVAGVHTLSVTFMPSDAVDYAPVTATTTITVTKAAPAVSLDASAASVIVGQSVTLTAAVTLDSTGGGTPTGTVTFFDGTGSLGAAPLDASGQAVLNVGGLGVGDHAITAVYSGDADRSGARSGGVMETVGPGGTQIVLVPHATLKGKSVAALSLTAEVEPLTPGGGIPTGVVTFMMKKKILARAALSGGRATAALAPGVVLNKPITVTYGGAAAFVSSSAASPPLTSKSLAAIARTSPKGSIARAASGPSHASALRMGGRSHRVSDLRRGS